MDEHAVLNKEPETGGKKKKKNKGLIIAACIVGALLVVLAVIVFGVYSGRHVILRLELGSDMPEASDFMRKGAKAEFVNAPDIDITKEGTYILDVKSGGRTLPELLIIRDTIAPQGGNDKLELTIDDEPVEALDALGSVTDVSDFTADWVDAPKFGIAGTYKCRVRLEDSCGNKRTVHMTVIIRAVKDVVEYEAGSAHPTVHDFLAVERDKAEFVTDPDSIEWNVPGDHAVEISIGGKTYTSTLRVTDTVAPKPTIVPAAVEKGGSIEASALALNDGDATAVTYEFTSKPVLSRVGTVTCGVKATDAAGNSTDLPGKIIVCDKIVTIEASLDAVDSSNFAAALGNEYAGYTFDSAPFSRASLGAHAVTLTNGSERITLGVVVKDTTAPTADAMPYNCCTGYYSAPENFVTNIVDISPVTARFLKEPDWDKEGSQTVTIVLTDLSGNEAEISSEAVIARDDVAPVIYAARDRYCYVGDAVSYFKEVFASDNADPEPTLDVDKSNVNSHAPGVYDVTYTATDRDGNRSSVTVKFTFIENKVSDEMLDEAVNGVMAEITNDSMTTAQKAYAIFNYCYDHILYTGVSDKTDWKGEAYRGITEGVGDCFTFYSTSYALLQKIDCRVLSVERLNGETQHFWCMVNLGTGWYQYDTCNVDPDHFRCFMKTNEELLQFGDYFWHYDQSLYPPVATTPFDLPYEY